MLVKVATAFIVKRTLRKWLDDGAFELAAVIAYYALFSLAPMLLIAITVAGLAFGEEAARGQVSRQIQRLTGQQAADVVEIMIDNAHKSQGSVFATVASIAVILVGATGVFSEMKTALNRIWGVPKRQRKNSVWPLIKKRLVAFPLVLTVGVLLLASVLANAALSAAVRFFPDIPGSSKVLLWGGDAFVSIILMAVLFAAIYKLLPDCDIAWRDVRTGALVTATLYMVGEIGIGLYLGYKGVASSYGAAGSVIVILMGVYYAALIFLLGAEFTNVYSADYRAQAAQPPVLEGGSETPVAAASEAPADVVTVRTEAASPALSSGDESISVTDGYPWTAVGVAMIAGIAVGALAVAARQSRASTDA
jgi:membrane protein